MRLRTVLAGAATSLVLVLAGCGADNPKPAPPETSSASPSASTSVVAPTMPAEAKGTGPGAAKAFVKHYLDVLGYAARTGDVAGLKALASPDCTVCNSITGRIEKIYGSGGKISGQGYAVASSRVQSAAGDSATLRIDVLQLPQEAVLAKGKPPTHYPESHLPSVFTLTTAGEAWSLRDWVRA